MNFPLQLVYVELCLCR